MKSWIHGAAALLLAGLLAGAPAGAVTVAGVAFSDSLRTRDAELSLHRASLLRWMGLFKVYVAALYLGPEGDPGRVLDDVPKRLEIQYLRGFTADQFAKATDVKIADNVDAKTLAALRPRIDQLNALYRDVNEGDRYALTYLPGEGTELALNGRPLGRVAGADFAAALFAVWLGDSPVDEDLKRSLLEDG